MFIEKGMDMCGGKGEITLKHILGDEEMHGNCTLFAEVTIPVGASLGYHEHFGESETYFVVSGVGEYDDNGEKRIIKAGEMTYTPDKKGHSITNAGDEDLVFMALIIPDKAE